MQQSGKKNREIKGDWVRRKIIKGNQNQHTLYDTFNVCFIWSVYAILIPEVSLENLQPQKPKKYGANENENIYLKEALNWLNSVS